MSISIKKSRRFKKQYQYTLNELEKSLMIQNQKSFIIIACLNSLQSFYEANKYSANIDYLTYILEKYKEISLQIKENKSIIKKAIQLLNDISYEYYNGSNKVILNKIVEEYNKLLNQLQANIQMETSSYDEFVNNYITNGFSMQKLLVNRNYGNKYRVIITDNDTLLISQRKKNVFLPYHVKDLREKVYTSKELNSVQQLIEKEYIIPLSKYKNPVKSRFIEGYSLMKNKENAPFLECVDLAFEMAFNKSLDPAIITACKNLDELDEYLDCLENKETQKFNPFKIKYELLPQKN